ncbi:MAG: ATP-binding protein [Lachnospiraceae bacterium]|nr:ATP-binding protein [Lachnospiraceae bacterium]MBR1853220.1 ATP-binding protein [Lachnospiraceae bacterium]
MNTPKNDIYTSESTAAIVRKAYLKLLPVQILGIVVAAINSFIDSLITGKFLGTEALAAIGFFGPVATVIGISWVVTVGVQILCSQYVGSGNQEDAISIFSTGAVFLSIFSLIITAFTFLFRFPLAEFLGAKGDTITLLSAYIAGYAPGIIGQVLSGVLTAFLPFNNDTKRSYVGIATMIVSNIGMDLLNVFVIHQGTFGMGVATSVSYLLSAGVLLMSYLNKEHVLRLRMSGFCFNKLPKAAYLGLPSLMFTVGCTAKGYILNLTLMQYVGDAAVAVMNVQNNIISILGAVPQGCAGALMTLAAMYFGDEDRGSLVELTRLTSKVGTVLSLAMVIFLMLCSSLIPSLFFTRTEPAWDIARHMLLLFPGFLVFNLFFGIFTKLYQCQGQMGLVNVLSFAETLGSAIIAVILTRFIGTDGVWLAFPIWEMLCILIIGISVCLYHKRIPYSLVDWMKLPDEFGASEDECMEFSVHSMDEVVNISEQVIEFCQARGLDYSRSYTAGLSIEEMAGNVVAHGFVNGSDNYAIDIRVVVKDALTIRIRDDCPAFDPKKYLDQFNPEDPTKNIGIRMIAKKAKEMIYQNIAGINTLLVKV